MVIGGWWEIGPKVDRFDWGWGLNGETLEVEREVCCGTCQILLEGSVYMGCQT